MTTPQPNPTDDLEAVGIDPIYMIVLDSLRVGTPGLSDKMRQTVARQINMKVNLHLAHLRPAGVEEAEPVAFGEGRVVVDTGKFLGKPAVFIAPISEPGVVGASAKHLKHDPNSLQPGERVLTFPTDEQAKAVADALVGATPAHPDDALIARVRDQLAAIADCREVVPFGTNPVDFCIDTARALLSDLKAGEGR